MNDLNLIDDSLKSDSLSFTIPIKKYVSSIAKWSKFFAILGFIAGGLMILIGLGLSYFMALLGSIVPEAGSMAVGSSIFGSLMYIAFSLLYIIPSLFAWRFSNKAKEALASDNQEVLTSAFENLKSCYKFWGITISVLLGIYVLMFLIALGLGGTALLFN